MKNPYDKGSLAQRQATSELHFSKYFQVATFFCYYVFLQKRAKKVLYKLCANWRILFTHMHTRRGAYAKLDVTDSLKIRFVANS